MSAPRLVVAALLAAMPAFAYASMNLRISEADDDKLRIEQREDAAQSGCPGAQPLYFQPLNSEVDERAYYLKAARMGAASMCTCHI